MSWVGHVKHLRDFLDRCLLRCPLGLPGSFDASLAQGGLAFLPVADESLVALGHLVKITGRLYDADPADRVVLL